MSLTFNRSSESITQSNLPISFIINSSQIEDARYNSFSSPRSDSATVIGKRLCSQSCISPNASEQKSNFPIPIQALNRITKSKTQAKVLMKKRKLKIKIQEQPAPVPRPVSKLVCSVPQVSKEKQKHKKKIKENPIFAEKLKINVPQTERSNVRMNKLLRKSAIFEIKKKKKERILKINEQKKKVVKKNWMREKNDKIRAENFVKFKMEKFSPKAAWGVDERKIIENEKVLKDIEIQRASHKGKVSDLDIRKKVNRFNRFVDMAEEFKPRSSSNPTERIPSVLGKESKKKVKKFMKNQKKKEKDKKENQIIETIQKETKRMISLKGLDSKVVKPKKARKIQDKLKVHFRPKKIGFPLESEDEIARIYADKSSEFLFEPESHLREEISSFSGDSIQAKPILTPKPDYSYNFISAIIKIQYFFRKYIKALHNPTIYKTTQKYLRKSESFPSSTQETAPKPDENSNKEEKNSEILQIDPQPQFSDDLTINDSLSEGLNRYQAIADILQSSGYLKNLSFPIDSGNIETYKQELQGAKDSKVLDFSFDSYISDQENSEKKQDASEELSKSEVSVKEHSQKDEDSDYEDRNGPLISRASPISEPSEEEINSKPVLFAETLNELAEVLISRLVLEIINFDSGVKKVESIEKDPIPFIDQLVFHIPSNEFKSNLSKPIRKNPLEVLAKLQSPDTYFTKDFDALSAPPLIPLATFHDIESFKLENFSTADLQEAQKIHDKLIFDNCNELLQAYRPYASEGLPLPWSSSSRVLKKLSYDVVKVLPKLARRLEVLSSFGAGKVCDENGEVLAAKPQNQLQSDREEKIGMLILQDIREKEGFWVDYEYEETQTVIDLASCVFEEMLVEALWLV